MSKRFVFLLALALTPFVITAVCFSTDESSSEVKRSPWTIDETYQGTHADSFQKLRYDVPVLMRQTMINLAVRLGLDFTEGWIYPLSIGFIDGAPMGVENVLAYVQLQQYSDGSVRQRMNINLAAYDKEHFNFDKVFAHELVHAMMNDAVGSEASLKLPVWLHEGLAVYGADQGEQMVRAYVSRFPTEKEEFFINGLDSPHGALDYAEDYLALKYIHDRHGVNSLHGFVRELVNQKGDYQKAIELACFENWDKFQEEAKKFSVDEIVEIRRDDRSRNSMKAPY